MSRMAELDVVGRISGMVARRLMTMGMMMAEGEGCRAEVGMKSGVVVVVSLGSVTTCRVASLTQITQEVDRVCTPGRMTLPVLVPCNVVRD